VIPREWLVAGYDTVRIRGFLAFSADRSHLDMNPTFIEFEHARAAMYFGRLEYAVVPPVGVRVCARAAEDPPEAPDPAIQLFALPTEFITTDPGLFTLVASPFVRADSSSEEAAASAIGTAAGLLAAFDGRNVLLQELFEADYREEGGSRVASPPYHPPAFPAEPDVSDDRVALIGRAATALAKRDEATQNRVSLSLDWFLEGLWTAGTDGLLRSWLAVEVLAMPNTSEIAPLKQALARLYHGRPEELLARKLVNRFSSLRDRVVHDGLRPPISNAALGCLRGVYVDVLLDMLGLPPQERTAQALARHDALTELGVLLAKS
jgi:hypothetical protein